MKSLKANQLYLFYRKYVFKIIEKTPRGNQTTMLYAGTLDEVKVVFPVGEFHLFAEIHEEAGAYATYDINIKFPTTLVSFRAQSSCTSLMANLHQDMNTVFSVIGCLNGTFFEGITQLLTIMRRMSNTNLLF